MYQFIASMFLLVSPQVEYRSKATLTDKRAWAPNWQKVKGGTYWIFYRASLLEAILLGENKIHLKNCSPFSLAAQLSTRASSNCKEDS